jgi:hypothetical protein
VLEKARSEPYFNRLSDLAAAQSGGFVVVSTKKDERIRPGWHAFFQVQIVMHRQELNVIRALQR